MREAIGQVTLELCGAVVSSSFRSAQFGDFYEDSMSDKNAYKASRAGQLQKKPNAKEPSFNTRVIEALVVLAVVGLLIGMFLPAVGGPREAAPRTVCLNNIRLLSLAMHNYESVNGHLPPAYIADENGKPMHSLSLIHI